ncbi:diacylglycerol kinase family protein [Aquimarina sp. AD10]|uniref:Diacylglycerol kinase n=1 Tax=Aquimarina aggregata TaxID=1642818 RepID=A0A162XCG6_9FLAO|nr:MULTISPECIES: diacylglycerol kinase family protein [Aquimarina]AXT60110.1 diacylglycerol kinase family protein [Aquimarina sp. AD10]KZS38547.1 diacylglycerol kinase [Aquimarina aggregata]RKN00097.1 diacylglycerol kinase family protein [Aquimarina sp. AD10]
MSNISKFVLGRLRGCGYAFKGALLLLKTEASIQVQAGIAIIMTILGFYFDITSTEWILQIFAIGLVMSIEGVNTTAEAIADFIHPDFHDKIGFIKDVAAGAVFIAAITAMIIGFIIYIPYFI